jgi:hypothetical protein
VNAILLMPVTVISPAAVALATLVLLIISIHREERHLSPSRPPRTVPHNRRSTRCD